MKTVDRFVLSCLLTSAVVASEPARATRPPGAEAEKSGFEFSLMPKAFSKNPTLEMTVNTELTPYGRGLPEVSGEHPAYYVAHDEGYRVMGETMGDNPPPASEIERHVIAALTERGYLPAGERNAPGLVLFFHWGTHGAKDLETAWMFPQQAAREQLERAVLVGGSGYVNRQSDRIQFGSTLFDFREKEEYLSYQIMHDLYYVVVSAYDYAALAKKERRLVWRTTMTVNATGVSMAEALPALVASASFYLGRVTDEPVAVMRNLRRGAVKLGPLRILERVPDPVPAPVK